MKRENWKYIILGVGLGFLIAAGLLLKFGSGEKESLSEKEIIERARALGMIFLTETMEKKPTEVSKESASDTDKQTTDEKTGRSEKDESAEKQDQGKKSEKVKEATEEAVRIEEADVIYKVITEPDNVPDLLPPKDPNRPKTDEVFQSNHF